MNTVTRRLRFWVMGLLPVIAVILVAVVVHDRNTSSGRRPDPDRPGPVLLVSGYGGGTGSLQPLATRLRAAGRTVVLVPPVGDNTGDLREQARALDRAARPLVAAGAPSVDVVGYSAGGVVVRLWVADLAGAQLARRVVTLGSPHHGTEVAAFAAGLLSAACPPACRQLAPNSELLSGLPETPAGPVWTSIWTTDDDVVSPPGSARLEGALDIDLQQICPDARVTHGGLPGDPLTVGLVRLALDGPRPATVPSPAPSPAQCARLRAAGSPGA